MSYQKTPRSRACIRKEGKITKLLENELLLVKQWLRRSRFYGFLTKETSQFPVFCRHVPSFLYRLLGKQPLWVIGLVLCLLWSVNEVKAQDVKWIKSCLLMAHDFYNRIVYTQDTALWGEKDYWATPEETLRRFKGDSEDIAIAIFHFFAKGSLRSDFVWCIFCCLRQVRRFIISRWNIIMMMGGFMS
ncbi:hypothetical protein [Vibrio owensii]|uniref:Uncharacterized protein n=1 Tax=Vibrio owensii CAIM 1854 = LMG 25443 TaxID=1229493 RepID=A0A0C1W598_9VIBR|nr:hypothetical protein [Vibrio owensii]KIF51587.1 hypothetical protein H735_18725 [Vibrio owensii CAIM 1854 = LMG 25443]